jgi:hypothetical protein
MVKIIKPMLKKFKPPAVDLVNKEYKLKRGKAV